MNKEWTWVLQEIRIGFIAGNQCNKLTELYPCDFVAMRRLRTCEESWWKLRQEVQYSPMIYHHLRMIWWFECRRPCWRSHFAELMILDRFTVSLSIHSVLILLHLLKFQGDKWWPHQAADGEANLMVGKQPISCLGFVMTFYGFFFLKIWGDSATSHWCVILLFFCPQASRDSQRWGTDPGVEKNGVFSMDV